MLNEQLHGTSVIHVLALANKYMYPLQDMLHCTQSRCKILVDVHVTTFHLVEGLQERIKGVSF